MEHNNCWPKCGHRSFDVTLFQCHFELWGKVLQVSLGRIPKELEQIPMQPVGSRAIDDHVRDGYHLQQEPCALVLIGRDSE